MEVPMKPTGSGFQAMGWPEGPWRFRGKSRDTGMSEQDTGEQQDTGGQWDSGSDRTAACTGQTGAACWRLHVLSPENGHPP